MDNLLIELQADGRARWRAGASVHAGTLADASGWARGRPVTLLVPGESVLLAQADIPSKSSSDIARALPYALEDWLLRPAETQHFAWTRDAGRVAAAVVAQDMLDGWIKACAAAGLDSVRISADVLALPWEKGEWTVLLEGPRLLVRTGMTAGFAGARALSGSLLQSAWSRCPEASRPRVVRVLHADGTLPEWPWPVPVREESVAPGAWVETPPLALNLRSGRYAARRGGSATSWRVFAAAVVLMVASSVSLAVTRYVILGREQAALEAGITDIFHRALPAERRLVDARAQLAAALAQARHGTEAGGLGLLAQVALPLTRMPGARLKRIVYQHGRLDLELHLAQPAGYAELRQALRAQGLVVDLQEPARSGDPAHLRVQAEATP